MTTRFAHDLLQLIADAIEIPDSHYERATDRYQSLGEWLQRPASTLAKCDPQIYAQGSFRLGTAVRPLLASAGYDLDLVSELAKLGKTDLTQQQLKAGVGREIVAYADTHSMNSEPQEGKRCWHLDYADDVHFHLDILPAIPEDYDTKRRLAAMLHDLQPSAELAYSSVAITDNTHPHYTVVTDAWPTSNPKGYGAWFDHRMYEVALPRLRSLVKSLMYASVDDVPAYAWKTPLQRAIQILKRHRDVMFQSDSKRKPISIIISTIAARAFEGQTTVLEALQAIVSGVQQLVRPTAPRVPNPVNPEEDFADKWCLKPERRLEQAFWEWITQLRADLDILQRGLSAGDLRSFLRTKFALESPDDELRKVCRTVPAVAAAPAVRIQNPARPHGTVRP